MRRVSSQPAEVRSGFKLLDLIVVCVVLFILAAVFMPMLCDTRVVGRRAECLNRMKNLGIASHNWATTNRGNLPGYAAASSEGEPMRSWVVDLLPYIDRNDLGDRWNYEEKWDSTMAGLDGSSNLSIASMGISVLRCPSAALDEESDAVLNYVVNSGFANRRNKRLHNYDQLAVDWNSDGQLDEKDHNIARDSGVCWLTTDDSPGGLNFDDFEDGAGNTILFGERLDSGQSTWAAPSVKNCAFTYPIDPNSQSIGTAKSDPLENATISVSNDQPHPPMLSSNHGDWVGIATAEGAVRTLNVDIDPDLLRRLITPRGSIHDEEVITEGY